MTSQETLLSIILHGGHPWGFSIKGGKENNKPLVISKLQKEGKAEIAGLHIGDVVCKVNNTTLSGFRNEAVYLVRTSGLQLTIQIKRNTWNSEIALQPLSTLCKNSENQKNNYNRLTPLDKVNQPKQSNISKLSYEVLETAPSISKNNLSLNSKVIQSNNFEFSLRKKSSPQEVASFQTYPAEANKICDCNDKSSFSTNDSYSLTNEELTQTVVRLRTTKARDRDIINERRRSWHPSNCMNAEDDTYTYKEQNRMRSPESGYVKSYASHPQYRQNLNFQPNKSNSKNWGESENLKSVYKPPVTSFNESPQFNNTYSSYKNSSRVEPFTCSAAMSSLRTNQENLPENHVQHRANTGSLEQIISSCAEAKEQPQSMPQVGIVSQQRNIFEQLCKKASSPILETNHESQDYRKIVKTDQMTSLDDDNYKFMPASRIQDKSFYSPFNTHNNQSSCDSSAYPFSCKDLPHRKRSYNSEDETLDQQPAILRAKNIPNNTCLDQKLKNLPHPNRRTADSSLPSPPARGESSIKTPFSETKPSVCHFHSRSTLQSKSFDSATFNVKEYSVQPTTVLPLFDKSPTNPTSSNRPQERFFGVMSAGDGKNVFATSTSRQCFSTKDDEKLSSFDKTSKLKNTSTSISETANQLLTKQMASIASAVIVSSSSTDAAYSGQPKVTTQNVQTFQHVSQHKTANESKAKGKYGSVWKRPQNQHRRVLSSDLSNTLLGCTIPETDHSSMSSSRLSVLDVNENMQSTKHKGANSERDSIITNPFESHPEDIQIDDFPSILKSLENTRHGSRYYKNFEPKTNKYDYDKLRFSESKRKQSVDRTEAAGQQPCDPDSNFYKDWKSQFKEVDLDEPVDGACSSHDRYTIDLKDISKKVLRVTSFTRKDLEVSPTQPLQEKRKRFQFPSYSSIASHQEKNRSLHTRSRSIGSELDEESSEYSSTSYNNFINSSMRSSKLRPKSAGLSRSENNKHTPASRTTVAPICNKPLSYYDGKSLTLPRNEIKSFDSDDSTGLCASNIISPQPFKTRNSPDKTRKDNREAVIKFISRKTGKSLDNDSVVRPKSASGYFSRSENTFRFTNQQITYPEEAKFEQKQLPHCKPMTLFKNEAGLSDTVQHDRTSSITSGDCSASAENLTDSGLDMSRASPSDHLDRLSISSSGQIKLSSSNYSSTKHEYVKPPPRKYPKQHRQRYSNSSSASSSATISTLSSLSSTSSTSIGRFPALGEEVEQSFSHNDSLRNLPQTTSSSNASHNFRQVLSRPSIDTGTYKVDKRKFSDKIAEENSKHCPDDQMKAKAMPVSSPVPMSNNVGSNDLIVSQIDKIANTENVKETRKPIDTMLLVQENVFKIIEKVKNLTSSPNNACKNISAQKPLSPPPLHHLPLDDAAEKLLSQIIERRQATDGMRVSVIGSTVPSSITEENFSSENKNATSSFLRRHGEDGVSKSSFEKHRSASLTPPLANSHEETINNTDSSNDLVGSDQKFTKSSLLDQAAADSKDSFEKDQSVPSCLNTNTNPIADTTSSTLSHYNEFSESAGKAGNLSFESAQSDKPFSKDRVSNRLIPDIPFFSLESAISLQEEHPDLTKDILEIDKSLAQILMAKTKTSDYMNDLFSLSAHDIVEEGMRYRTIKSNIDESKAEVNNNSLSINERIGEKLPASSTYYKTSASKARILTQMQEMIADGQTQYEGQEDCDKVNGKKMELILSIKSKLDDLRAMKGYLENETRENECLGRQVHKLIKNVCSEREQEKYNIFVQDVDKIIKLLLSLSGRLARVENAMLSSEANKEELNLLSDKRKKLTEQHAEAKQLKANIDRRQKIVSDILLNRLNDEQFADYEHFIKMKSALIVEQRELDDKVKLGQEQIQCLRDSLPVDWQTGLDKVIGE